MSRLTDFAIHATDGNIGKVRRFLFEDEDWALRYLVVETGNWIKRKELLISPIFIDALSWQDREIHVNLAREQVRQSPQIETAKPISRRQEREFYSYYQTPAYWSGYGLWGTGMHPEDMLHVEAKPQHNWQDSEDVIADSERESKLRSSQDFMKHRVYAYRGEVGKINDLIFDDKSWAIRYLVIEPKRMLHGRQVLLSPWWIREISWRQRLVFVDIENATIEDAPTFDPNEPITPAYEERLIRHYGRTVGWKKT
jgi:sporulation protein YlmC with PRC-barrel domain